ncbi:unnamed protein product, partial [Pocillopora meandrina]
TVLGPVLSSIFINDIKAVNTDKNLLVKFADDITVSLPIEANVGLDESQIEQVPVNWDTHIDSLLSKASSRLYILRICKYYGYSKENLDLLF